jgi:acetylornithine/N-succinyldiaminopimelate aminotransferase
MMPTQELIKRESQAIIQTYTRQSVALVKGSGARVWDPEGKEYLDFVGGIAVNNVGHCHPKVVEAIKKQAEWLIHTSNLYYTENQVLLAEELKQLTGMKRAFFCNSGAESVEAALKLTRRAIGKSKIVAAAGCFHGRTLGALGATYKAMYREPFRPLNEADFIPYNDIESLKTAVTKETGAVILEPVQGEAGVYVPNPDYLRAARQICNDAKTLLIFDEVQTGFGRTGKWFGKEHSGVQPDIMTLAKATIDVIRTESLVQRSEELGAYMRSELKKLGPREIRGLGLMIGLDLDADCKQVVQKAIEKGVLLNNTGDHTIRLVPPLMVTKEQIDRVVKVIGESL